MIMVDDRLYRKKPGPKPDVVIPGYKSNAPKLADKKRRR
jgi:hypothetical protein